MDIANLLICTKYGHLYIIQTRQLNAKYKQNIASTDSTKYVEPRINNNIWYSFFLVFFTQTVIKHLTNFPEVGKWRGISYSHSLISTVKKVKWQYFITFISFEIFTIFIYTTNLQYNRQTEDTIGWTKLCRFTFIMTFLILP